MEFFKPLKQPFSAFFEKIKRKKKRRKRKKIPINDGKSYTKNIVSFILVNAVVWVYLTYILAFMDKTAIAEQLSIVVVKVIIYTILSYLIKALVENVFKFNFVSKMQENPYISEEVIVDTSASASSECSESVFADSEITDTNDSAG